MNMPALFIGHGSPMNTIERNGYTQAWRDLGKAMPTPRAVLVVSAHWFIGLRPPEPVARHRARHAGGIVRLGFLQRVAHPDGRQGSLARARMGDDRVDHPPLDERSRRVVHQDCRAASR
jgi:hypothetical protein